MPTLTWIGKDKVVNHHHDVPFRVLEQQYSFGEADSFNRIIHGDNLEALKALLPYYEGRIKCIYIDPPYNTGNENWVYNDNVSDPKLKRWLGKVVGKESEDLTRHDKWLCMMYPRLVLLNRLLADDGTLFVSIDDIEVSSLRILLDEIFGRNHLISQFIWKSRVSEDARSVTGVSNDHEYILCYHKKDLSGLRGVEKDLTKFTNPDNDVRGPWRSADLTGLATREQRPNLHYDLTDPVTGTVYESPPKGWRFEQSTMAKRIAEARILFPNLSSGRPRQKVFVNEMSSAYKAISSVILSTNTAQGTRIINEIFGTSVFDFPKPVELPQMLIEQVTHDFPDAIILDSFAGSGTTAHAVLNLNKQDGGNRQFILVEMEDYAETITAERVRRVIDGYGTKEGTGGGFAYYELGPALFTEDNLLNETVPLARIREYIWYSETRTPLPTTRLPETGEGSESPHFLGKLFDTAYYFYYEPDQLTTLDYDFLPTIQTPAEQYVVYADNCLIAREWLQQRHIIFKKIPRDISRF
ncbi:MAG: site-specific DNA-methyltransferase [Spirosoma sp.]|nr:site-specific DNA-methyltransferase [Spirosoma sp.]